MSRQEIIDDSQKPVAQTIDKREFGHGPPFNNIFEYNSWFFTSPTTAKQRKLANYRMGLILDGPEETAKCYGKTLEEVEKEADEGNLLETQKAKTKKVVSKLTEIVKLIEKNPQYHNNVIIQIDENGEISMTKADKIA